jgi:hypothetical protein
MVGFPKTKKEKSEKEKDTSISRSDISIVKCAESHDKMYFVTSMFAGSSIREACVKTAFNFCQVNDAQFVILPMRGVLRSTRFPLAIYEQYRQYFATQYDFNENLAAMDFLLSPQQIISSTGISRFTKKGKSIIAAHTKQNMESIPSPHGTYPHLIYFTGCISEPEYSEDRIGHIAKQDHVFGGLIITVKNNKIFHIRNVQFDKDGGMCDLDRYYYGDNVVSVNPSIVLGDSHVGIESKIAHTVSKKMIQDFGCQKIFMHDLVDFRSINPHEKDDLFAKYNRPECQKTLQSELDYAGSFLEEFTSGIEDRQIVVIPSNHDEFLIRYLKSGEFVKDRPDNAKLAAELFSKTLDGYNPTEYYFKSRGYALGNVNFPDYTTPIIEHGYTQIHGSYGVNGAKGSLTSFDKCFDKSVSGNAHGPAIFRRQVRVGTLSKTLQDYNKKNAGTTGMATNCLLYPNGTFQLLNIIDGEYR